MNIKKFNQSSIQNQGVSIRNSKIFQKGMVLSEYSHNSKNEIQKYKILCEWADFYECTCWVVF